MGTHRNSRTGKTKQQSQGLTSLFPRVFGVTRNEMRLCPAFCNDSGGDTFVVRQQLFVFESIVHSDALATAQKHLRGDETGPEDVRIECDLHNLWRY